MGLVMLKQISPLIYRCKSFWAPWHHLKDPEVVIPWFSYYVKLASNPGATPGGLTATRLVLNGSHWQAVFVLSPCVSIVAVSALEKRQQHGAHSVTWPNPVHRWLWTAVI